MWSLLLLLGGARADTCAEGSYATTNESAWGRACAGWAPCPVGHYCVDGARHARFRGHLRCIGEGDVINVHGYV